MAMYIQEANRIADAISFVVGEPGRLRVLSGRFLMLAGLLVAAASAWAQTWDVQKDWAPPANPNGAWTYGEYLNGKFVNLFWSGSQYEYSTNSLTAYVSQNTSSQFAYGINPGQISLEADWGDPVARWTAPTTALYNVAVAIGGSNAYIRGGWGNNFVPYAGLKVNGVIESTTSYVNNIKTWDFAHLQLNAGDTIDAYVLNPGYAQAGNTQLEFRVAPTEPEPASFVIVGLGLLGLVRRRSASARVCSA